MQYSKACDSFLNFLHGRSLPTTKLLNTIFLVSKLKPSPRKFYGRHDNGKSMSQMTSDAYFFFSLSPIILLPSLTISIARRVSYTKQELLTFRERIGSQPIYWWVLVSHILVFCLLVFVLCAHCCRRLRIVHSWLSLKTFLIVSVHPPIRHPGTHWEALWIWVALDTQKIKSEFYSRSSFML